MTIFKLTESQIRQFAELPEVAMATQVALDEDREPMVIASGRIAIKFDNRIQDEMGQLREHFVVDGPIQPEELGPRLESWVRTLPTSPVLDPVPIDRAWAALAFIHLGPRFPLPGVPYRPSYTHGHLPFHGTCGGVEKYYRYEQFATSKRIDLKTYALTQTDTYAAPESEVTFTPTGLSAVGRFALPLLLPACWRYELTPPAGTLMYYGASVPLYGQSGGAVEVMFPKPFTNNGKIPKPTVLPIL